MCFGRRGQPAHSSTNTGAGRGGWARRPSTSATSMISGSMASTPAGRRSPSHRSPRLLGPGAMPTGKNIPTGDGWFAFASVTATLMRRSTNWWPFRPMLVWPNLPCSDLVLIRNRFRTSWPLLGSPSTVAGCRGSGGIILVCRGMAPNCASPPCSGGCGWGTSRSSPAMTTKPSTGRAGPPTAGSCSQLTAQASGISTLGHRVLTETMP